MTQPRPTLLLIRPETQSQRFAAEFRQRFGADWPVLISPLMRIGFQPLTADPSGFAGLIFSSENGVAAFAARAQRFSGPCHCVGNRTAEAARAQGFAVGLIGPDAQGLLSALVATGARGPLLHLHGRHVTADLGKELISAGIETKSAVIYAQEVQPITVQATAALQQTGPVLLPLFSPRSARLFQKAALGVRSPLWVAALSKTVAQALTLVVARGEVAERPDGQAMMEALARLLMRGQSLETHRPSR